MEYGIFEILKLIGALGLFIYGMKVMSEGIQKIAGSKLREILAAMTSNRIAGVFTGFLTTAVIQSSSATTVMIVSFVNAGLLTLRQAIGVIMGANIGTTVTAVLITTLGFSKFSLSDYALPVIAIGFPLMFSSNTSLKSLSEFLIGFAILFIGLDELKHAVPDLEQVPGIEAFIAGLNEYGYFSILIFVLIGTLITVVVQSSSAAMALTLTFCAKDIIGFENAAAIILGENIGTTITANLAALIGNVYAKRAARAHLIFNIFGVFWMIFLFSFFIHFIDWEIGILGGESPLGPNSKEGDTIQWALTLFHINFNIINALILIWFVNLIEKVVVRMVPSKGKIDKEYHLEYIDKGVMGTPELSLLEARKEVAKFGTLTVKMLGFFTDLFQAKEPKKISKRLAKIQKYEDITDKVEVEIADYLLNVSKGELTEASSLRVRSMLSIINDLERIGDLCFQMSKNVEKKIEERTWFSPEQRNNLLEMLALLDKGLSVMVKNLSDDYAKADLAEAEEIKQQIIERKKELRKEHLIHIENGDYNIRSGLIYTDLFMACEKIADHITNVTQAVKGKV